MLPKSVKIVEVGPRDGLQSEALTISVADRISLIQQLAAAGVSYMEAGSFVSEKWVPQMANSDAVVMGTRGLNAQMCALTPNSYGLENAIAAGADEVAVFIAASESFSQKNTNCSIAESLERVEKIVLAARAANLPVRGYVSCVFACPYDGTTDPELVAQLSKNLLDLGCYEISLGDTTGIGTVADVHRLLDQIETTLPLEKFAVHFHDSYGQALANIYAAMQRGISVVDSAVAGLGGCPYAKGASGNVASEDLVYFLNGMGIEHGVNLEKLVEAGNFISSLLGRKNASKVAIAINGRK